MLQQRTLGQWAPTAASWCIVLGAILAAATAARADIVGFDDPVGFTPNENGNAAGLPSIVGDIVTMTTALGSQATSLFYNEKQDIDTFTASFDYQDVSIDGADGLAFIIQNDVRGLNALGAVGGSRGYMDNNNLIDINNSAALLLNIYQTSDVAIGMNGLAGPAGPTAPVNLRSGNTISVTVEYDGSDLILNMTEQGTANTFSYTQPGVYLRTVVGGQPTAWVGFSAGTGGVNAEQRISNFLFSGEPMPELTWDGNGNGLWGQSRWDGVTPPNFPVDDATGRVDAVINSANQTVTVAANRSAYSLDVSAGAVNIGQNNTLAIATQIDATAITLQNGATLTAGGGGSIDQLTIGASSTIGIGTGSMSVGQLTDGGAPATLIKTGGGSLELGGPAGSVSLVSGSTVEVAEGSLRSIGDNPLGNAQTVRLTGGTLIVGVNPENLSVGPNVPTAGLKLWLDADDPATLFQDTAGTTPVTGDGQQVAMWADKSGNSLHVTEVDVDLQPAYATSVTELNAQPAIHFAGDVLQAVSNSTGIVGEHDLTLITVWANAEDTGEHYQHTFHMGSGGGSQAYGHSVNRQKEDVDPTLNGYVSNHYWGSGFSTTHTADAGPTMALSTWEGAASIDRWWVNGDPAGELDRDALNIGADQLTVGSRLNPSAEGAQADIAEVLVFDRVLNEVEREQVGLYLQQKYNLPASYDGEAWGSGPVNMLDTSVIVTENSTLDVETSLTAEFGPLTLQNNVLSLRGALGGITFASMTIAPGATAVGLKAETDVTVNSLQGGPTANFVKSGPGSLILAGPTAGMENTTVDVQDGGLTMTAGDLALAGLTAPAGAVVDTGGDRLIVSGDLQLGKLTYSAAAASSFAAIGSNLSDSADLDVLTGTLTVTSDSVRLDRTDPVGSGIVTANEPTDGNYAVSPPGEQKENAFDNNIATKWLSFTDPVIEGEETWLAYQFPGGNRYVVNEYEVSSANDAPERDPKNWRLEGSNDGTTWDVLDTRTDQSFASRYNKQSFFIDNEVEYEHYRFFIEERFGVENSTQLSEIALFSTTLASIAMDNVTMAPNTTLELGSGVSDATIGNLTAAAVTTIRGAVIVENSLSMAGNVGSLTVAGEAELELGEAATYGPFGKKCPIC